MSSCNLKNSMGVSSVKKIKQQNESFKCPACGLDMTHATDTSLLSCVHCGHTENACASNTDLVNFDFTAAEGDAALQDWGAPVKVFNCQSCGIKMVSTEIDLPTSCAFCTAASLVSTESSPGLHPDALIPFKIDAANAGIKIAEWMGKRYFTPFSFKAEYTGNPLIGVFLPYWSFDARVNAAYTGQAANSYTDTEINTVTSSDHTETKSKRVKKLRWRFVSGKLEKKFSNVIFNDVTALDTKTLEKLEPYKLNELVNYAPKHLAGYQALRGSNGLAAVWNKALDYMGGTVRTDVLHTVKRGADAVGAVNTCAEYSDIGYKQLLLPVWIWPYQYKKKVYYVYINGQTGVIFGRSPKSLVKFGLLALAAAAVIAALILFVL